MPRLLPFWLFFSFFSTNFALAQPYSEIAALDTMSAKAPFLQSYWQNVKTSLQQQTPVLTLTLKDSNLTKVQNIALSDARFKQFLFDEKTRKPFRNEIFRVEPARQSDIRRENAVFFQRSDCFRIEMYNFALNCTTVGVVCLSENRVIDAALLQHTAADIPQHLKEIALKIATESPEVATALGFKPSADQALMADTKTALNRSRCERSQHLCVAPTFVKGEEALWAIVDLTDLRLVGVRWTNVSGSNSGAATGNKTITQRTLEYEHLTECFCKKETSLARNGWNLNYMLTSSDGLRISDIKFKEKLVVSSAKLVDWHVSYSKTEGFGYSDAIGCPFFSTATVLAVESPRVYDLIDNDKKVGFVLEQGFHSEGWPTPCNYNYVQRYEFYDDGRLRCATASVGRGCGNDGTYRPVFRIAFPQNDNNFAEWNGKSYDNWQKEKWQLQTELTTYDQNRFQYRIADKSGNGFHIEPSKGQFSDKGRGDNAYAFVTKSHPDKDEGETDLITIGPCCNTDYHQGPEQFIEPTPEAITNQTLVLWYVPQMKNDNAKGSEYCWAETYLKDGVQAVRTFPCFAGPMLVPIAPLNPPERGTLDKNR